MSPGVGGAWDNDFGPRFQSSSHLMRRIAISSCFQQCPLPHRTWSILLAKLRKRSSQSDCLAFSSCADCVAFWGPGPATGFWSDGATKLRAPTQKPADRPSGPDKTMGAVPKTSQGTTADVYSKPQNHLQCVRVSVGQRQFSILRKRVR